MVDSFSLCSEIDMMVPLERTTLINCSDAYNFFYLLCMILNLQAWVRSINNIVRRMNKTVHRSVNLAWQSVGAGIRQGQRANLHKTVLLIILIHQSFSQLVRPITDFIYLMRFWRRLPSAIRPVKSPFYTPLHIIRKPKPSLSEH
jgi:hypothetical protein